MSKLVILNQGMTGRSYDLVTERITVGRVEDNAFQIADGSVSSHHAEVVLRGNDILIRDLNSTNGTFINGEKITEMLLKPGQILRFGQVELKIDDGRALPAPPPAPVSSVPPPSAAPFSSPSAPSPAPAPATAVPPERKTGHGTMVVARGVSMEQLEQGGTRAPGFDTKGGGFSKKTNKINTYFIVGGIVVGVIIIVLILMAMKSASTH